jgi:N6-L-threonylcarbamoyladenine synthase
MMGAYLGIDTSNYTTSAALYDCGEGVVLQKKMLLPVRKGEKGVRQSEAIFHHTAALPALMEQLMIANAAVLSAVGVSVAPRDAEGSYMPCFLAGACAAGCIGAAAGIPVYRFSHQAGHIAAVLYAAGRLDLLKERFIAFHVSGGTTDVLLAEPDDNIILKTHIIGETLDLNAGQAVDRTGVMLGLQFPCGAELEKLALESKKAYSPDPIVKSGNCCLSGLENQCMAMFAAGESAPDISLYCIEFIGAALVKMAEFALKSCGALPLVFSGGVMSNSIIRRKLTAKFDACFAEPAYSSDNAAGVAVLANLRHCSR